METTLLVLVMVFIGSICGDIRTEDITKAFKDILNANVKYEEIEKSLEKLTYTSVKVDGDQIVKDFSNKVSSLFKSKENVLDSLKLSVEKAKANYSNQLFVKEFDYLNMRDIDSDETLQLVDGFSSSFKINTSNSFVQVPTNIYKYKQSVLKQVEWSRHLDEQFRMNYESEDENLQYQYYGDSSGIFRLFPGSVIPIKEDTGTDLFDCRRRPWYIQASTSPKDIVIVIDVSGSMIGNNIGIAKIAASSLIDTLQENDYFNVITVNKEVNYAIPCIEYLIQATKENKEMMKEAVQDNITSPTSIVKVEAGMDEAFKILRVGPKVNRTSAGCNQAIMFITDGIEGDYAGKASFERNNKDKRVRVFSYLVGRMKNPDKDALVKMSCENGGHFYTIDTLGNVWDTVLDYLRIMSRPITHSMNNNNQQSIKATFTPAYLDSAGFGMVMSVSKGVFEKRTLEDGSVRYSHLIGVVGTDISLNNLSSLADYSEMGTFSRGYIFNNNGFVLVHPKFKEQKGYLPVPPNILIDDLEISVEEEKSTELKEKMLGKDIQTSKEFQTYWLYDNNRRFIIIKNKYFHKPVDGTDFVAAVAVAEEDEYYNRLEGNDELFDAGIEALFTPEISNSRIETDKKNSTNTTNSKSSTNLPSNVTYVDVAPWDYCLLHGKDEDYKGIKKPLNARQLYEFLKKNNRKDIYSLCNVELLKRLLLMAGAVDNITKMGWDESSSKLIDGIFFSTAGGYNKYMTFSNGTKPLDSNIIRSKIFHDILEYSQSVYGDKNKVLTFSTSAAGNTPESIYRPSVIVSKSFWKDGILTAVSGVNVNSDVMNKIFMGTVDKIESGCKNSTNLCALIDSFGYIVASNQHSKYTGQFVGERLGFIVDEFNDTGIFEIINISDTQAQCIHSDEPSSSANILLTPAKIILGALSVFLSSTYWFLVQVGIILVSFFEQRSKVDAGAQDAYLHTEVTISCTKLVEYYTISRTKVKEQQNWKNFDCGEGCENVEASKSPSYRIKHVPETNIYLLMVRAGERGCDCFGSSRTPQTREMIRSTEEWCSQKPNYRKAPSTCFNETRTDHKDACGSSYIIFPSYALMFFTTLSSIIFLKFR